MSIVRVLFCENCGQMRPAYECVNVIPEEGGQPRNLCSQCHCDDFMRRTGLPRLETVYFETIKRYDTIGRAHTFHFVVQMDIGIEIRAFELIHGEPGGYQFFVLEPADSSVHEAHAKLVHKLEAGLAVRYLLAPDLTGIQDQNRLHLNGMAANGRVDEDDRGQVVVVDGQSLTWEQFGRCLSSFTGFNFRLELFDPHETPEISCYRKPSRPLWWQPDPEPVSPEHLHH